MITGKQLAEFAVKCYQDGVRYWYGTCYYKCTTSLFNSKSNQYPSHYTDARKSAYQKDIAAGAMCCDCIGLIKGAFWSELGTRTAKYGSNNCPDKGANSMFDYCKSKKALHGDMSTFPDEPGLLLHKSGHVGVSIGGGQAIEAKGFADDVVMSKVSTRGWTGWARLPFADYGDGEEAVTVPSVKPSTTGKLGERTLRNGCKGDDVTELQTALVALKFDCGKFGTKKNGVDGNFGNATEAAVKTFQTVAGIAIDGVFGPASLKALRAMQEAGAAPETTEEGDVGDDGSEDAPTFTVTIPNLDGAVATYLLEAYPGSVAVQE